jgi:hypothetical protein
LAYSSSTLNVGAVCSSETSTRLHRVTSQNREITFRENFTYPPQAEEVPFDISCHVGYLPCGTVETGTNQGRKSENRSMGRTAKDKDEHTERRDKHSRLCCCLLSGRSDVEMLMSESRLPRDGACNT